MGLHGLPQQLHLLVLRHIRVAHGLDEGQRVHGGRADGVGAAQVEHAQGGALVGGARLPVDPVVGQLEGHLDEGVRAQFLRLGEVLSKVVEHEHRDVQVLDHDAEILLGLLDVALDRQG